MIRVLKLEAPLYGVAASSFSYTLRDAARSVPGVTWSRGARAWVGYPDAVAAVVETLSKKGIDVADRKCLPKPGRWPEPVIPTADKAARAYQQVGLRFLLAQGPTGALLADEMGLGKQHAITTRVATPKGWRRIGELQVGDRVFGSDGRPIRVTGVFPQGTKPSYRVHFSDGAHVAAGPEHLWAVLYLRGGRSWTPLTLTTDDLRLRPKKGRLTLKRTSLRLPMLSAPLSYDDPGPLPLDGYVLGALIANGSMVGNTTARLTFHVDDLETIRTRIPNLGKIAIYGKAARATVFGAIRATRKLGLNVHSGAKFIPKKYQRAPTPIRIALLQGLMDGDGSCSAQHSLVYHTTARQLAKDVRRLVEGLGGLSSIRTYDRTKENKPVEYQVRLRLPTWVLPFSTARKAARYRPGSHARPTRTVSHVVREADVESVCIAVDAPDQLYVTEHCILTHNTLQAVTAARAVQNKTLVLCPSHARGVWARLDPERGKKNAGELQKWWPAAEIVCLPEGIRPFTPLAPVKVSCGRCLTCLSGLEDECPKRKIVLRPKEHDGRYPSVMRAANVVVIHFDIAHAWVDVLIRWGFRTVIIDEAHLALVNARSRRSQAIRRLVTHATMAIALTGTPPVEKPRDLWNLIDTISPGRFGNFFNYGLRFCDGHKEEVTKDKTVWRFDGKSNLEELAARLKFFCLRRTKKEVGLEIPPLTRQVIDVEIPAKKRVRVNANTLKSKKMMRECLNLAADGKLNPAIELIAGHAEEGHHVVVFTWRRAIASYIANAMAAREIPSDIILGGVSETKRRARIAKAKSADRHVLCCTIDSTSTAIDLTHADVAVFVELTWEPHELRQAEARLNRFGQTKPMLIQYIIARGTGDELILDCVIHKLDTFETVIGETGDGIRGDLGREEEDPLAALAARLEKLEETWA